MQTNVSQDSRCALSLECWLACSTQVTSSSQRSEAAEPGRAFNPTRGEPSTAMKKGSPVAPASHHTSTICSSSTCAAGHSCNSASRHSLLPTRCRQFRHSNPVQCSLPVTHHGQLVVFRGSSQQQSSDRDQAATAVWLAGHTMWCYNIHMHF